MAKMPNPGKHERHAAFIGGGNHFRIPDGTAGLYCGRGSRISSGINKLMRQQRVSAVIDSKLGNYENRVFAADRPIPYVDLIISHV